jgi:prepilin-type N-terminal cleavage/methylation domain-containing protein
MKSQKPSGFTLIELVVVIGILLVLTAIVLVAINPSRQLSLANNSKRQSDVNTILNAVQQYSVNKRGTYPAGISSSALTIKKSGGVDLCAALVPTYIAALPVDPLTNNGTAVTNCGSAYNTNYTIVKSAVDSRVTVSAPAAEATTIRATQ